MLKSNVYHDYFQYMPQNHKTIKQKKRNTGNEKNCNKLWRGWSKLRHILIHLVVMTSTCIIQRIFHPIRYAMEAYVKMCMVSKIYDTMHQNFWFISTLNNYIFSLFSLHTKYYIALSELDSICTSLKRNVCIHLQRLHRHTHKVQWFDFFYFQLKYKSNLLYRLVSIPLKYGASKPHIQLNVEK